MAISINSCQVQYLGKCPKIYCGDIVDHILYNFGEVINGNVEYYVLTRWNQEILNGMASVNGSNISISNLLVTVPDMYYVHAKINGATREIAKLKISKGKHCEEIASYCLPTISEMNGIGASQPSSIGFWLNNGVLTFWNGTENKIMDFIEGESQSLFGTPLGDV